jgi:hypothetical protein
MELQDLLYDFVMERLTKLEQKKLYCSSDILKKLDEESEEEIKTELYNRFLDRVRWNDLIRDIQSNFHEEEESEESEEEE